MPSQSHPQMSVSISCANPISMLRSTASGKKKVDKMRKICSQEFTAEQNNCRGRVCFEHDAQHL